MAKSLKKKFEAPKIVEVEKEEKSIAENMTEEEVKLVEASNNEEGSANTEKLSRTTNLLSNKFNLNDSYRVNSFNDKGKVVTETFENKDFIITVTVKDSARHGLAIEYDE